MLYANPFPMTAESESVKNFFEKECKVRVLSVRLRRHIVSKEFSGSIFVEFATEEDAEKVNEMSNELVYEGTEVTLMFMKEYLEKKKKEKEEKEKEKERKSKEEKNKAKMREKTDDMSDGR